MHDGNSQDIQELAAAALKTSASLKRRDLILYYGKILLNGLDKLQTGCCLIWS